MFVIKSVEAAVAGAKARLTVPLTCGEQQAHAQLSELLVMLEAIGIVKIEPEAAPQAPVAPPPPPAPPPPQPEPASAGSPAAPAAEVPAGTA